MSNNNTPSKPSPRRIKQEGGYDSSRLAGLMSDYQIPGATAAQTEGRLGSLRPNTGEGAPRFTPTIPGSASGVRFTPNVAAVKRRTDQDKSTEPKEEKSDKKERKKFAPNVNTRTQRPRQPFDRRTHTGPVGGGLAPPGASGGSIASIASSSHDVGDDHMETEEDKKEEENMKKQILKEVEEDYFKGLKQPPITLPFNKQNVKQESEGPRLPRTHELEEEEFSAKKGLFAYNIERLMAEDQLFFIQLPSSLPISAKRLKQQPAAAAAAAAQGKGGKPGAAGAGAAATPAVDVKLEEKKKPSSSVDDEENIWTANFENTLTKVPAGYIGEMVVFKSGKTKLKLGQVVLEVVPGADFGFLEHVLAVSAETKQAFVLGDVSKRIVCNPDVEYMLQHESMQTMTSSSTASK